MIFLSSIYLPETFCKDDLVECHKVKLLNFLYLLLPLFLLIGAIYNITILQQTNFAIFELLFILPTFIFFYYFRVHNRVDIASYAIIVMLGVLLLTVMVHARGVRDAGALIVLFPLITFQLLNLKNAIIIHTIFTIIILATIAFYAENWTLIKPAGTLLNIFLALLLSAIIVTYLKNTISTSIYKLHYQSTTDNLTKIANRMSFLDKVQKDIEPTIKEGEKHALIMFDIDFFKHINDTYGHDIGDSVLIEFSSVIKSHIRKHDLLARWGGEEFMLLLPYTELSEAIDKTEQILNTIRAYPFTIVKKITASAGVTQFKINENVEETLKRADELLYKAKNSGRDTFCSK